MLVLTREVGEFMLIGDSIEVRVLRVEGGQVRIGIIAPRHISIKRGELIEEVRNETSAAALPTESIVANIAARIKANAEKQAPKP
jgi:carbon storage regulator